MTANYEPFPTVVIAGGLNVPYNTLSNIRISSGRRDVLNQPSPGYATVEIWVDPNEPLKISLSEALTVSINKGTSGTQTIFTGVISDIDISLPQYGQTGAIALYRITAVSALAQLNKRVAGTSGYSKEFDGDRVFNILFDAFVIQWLDLDTVTTWSDLPSDVTWDSYDATGTALVAGILTNVDRPGTYELTAFAAERSNAYELAQEAAQSGRGVLWEDGAGALHYDDYAARAFNTPLVLSSKDLLANGLSSSNQWGELANDVTIIYKNNQTQNAQDGQSQVLYGQLEATKGTILENAADAQTQANDYLFCRAYPRNYPAVLSVALHSPLTLDTTRDQLAAVYNGLRISTSDLPAVFGTTFDGFVEGWEWNLTRYTADLSLYVSAYSETYRSTIWAQVNDTITWNTYNPTTIWENA